MTRLVEATDGVRLAVQEWGEPQRQTVVAVHGFPDNRAVWTGLAELLAARFHVVAYDVRGTGESGEPSRRRGYRIEQLRRDLRSIIDACSPDEPVHLLAHDWGSIQSWAAATSPEFADRLLSFTSISGPSLDMAGRWLRDVRLHPRNLLRQAAASWYIVAFQFPWLPEALVRRGAIEAIVDRSQNIGLAHHIDRRGSRPRRDQINGIELYRANIGSLFRPRPEHAVCPVLVLAPTDDVHVTVPLALEAPAPYVRDMHAERVGGNHWVVENDPHVIAARYTDFVASL